MKKDNCKDCVSKCEHAGKDREFVCVGGVSCKVKSEFDINKVKIIWDFAPNDEPCVLFAYVDKGKIWIIGKCDTSDGVVGVDELKKMWEKTTSTEAVKEYREQIEKWLKFWKN